MRNIFQIKLFPFVNILKFFSYFQFFFLLYSVVFQNKKMLSLQNGSRTKSKTKVCFLKDRVLEHFSEGKKWKGYQLDPEKRKKQIERKSQLRSCLSPLYKPWRILRQEEQMTLLTITLRQSTYVKRNSHGFQICSYGDVKTFRKMFKIQQDKQFRVHDWKPNI